MMLTTGVGCQDDDVFVVGSVWGEVAPPKTGATWLAIRKQKEPSRHGQHTLSPSNTKLIPKLDQVH
jgi:hypothetical protein